MKQRLGALRYLLLAGAVMFVPVVAEGQDSTSAPLVAELVQLLDEMKLDSAAAAQDAGFFAGALYLPGSQLLVVRGTFAFPDRPTVLIDRKMYRDVYIELNSAAEADGKVFISDLGADGLRFRRENNQPFDTVDMSGRSYSFDGDWGKAKLSRDEYTQAFQRADTQYAQMLRALIAQIKKPS